MKLGIVLPAYKNDNELVDGITGAKKYYPDAQIIAVCDDEDTALAGKIMGAFVPYHPKKLGFAKSLCEGLCLAWYTFDCDIIVAADPDHPFSELHNFLDKMDKFDVVVGFEKGTWKQSRVWSNQLVRKFIVDKVRNPTCGFVVFNKTTLSLIPWEKLVSHYDMIHPELLYYADKTASKITECEFTEVQKKRFYSKERYIYWLISFIRVAFINKVF
jgi:hypothetical protein